MNVKWNEKFSQIKETFITSKRLLKLIWTVDKRLFIATGVAAVIPAIIPFINIYIYKLIIDMIVGFLSGGIFNYPALYFLLALRVFTYFLQDAAFATQGFVERLFWTKVPIVLSQIAYAKTSSLDIQYFEDSKFQDLLEKVRQNVDYRPQNLVNNLFYGMQSLVQVTIALVAIANLNILLAALVILVSVPEFISQSQQSKIAWGIWDANTAYRKKRGWLSALLQHPRNAKEIKLFRLAKTFLADIKLIEEKFAKENNQLAKRNYLFNLSFSGVSTVVFIGVEIFIIFEALARRVSVGDIGFYTGVVSNFQNGLGGLSRNLSGVYDHSLYVKSLFELLDAKPLILEVDNPIKVNFKKAPKIEFKDVDFIYPGATQYILKDFSLVINPGEKVAFVGENGAGKSTLIKLLARFYDVNKGEILINDINIKNLELDSWYKSMGVLFQDFLFYEDTVTNNIHYGKVYEDLDLEKIQDAARSSGAHPVIEKLDKQYDQMLGKLFEGGVELSTGQWQKIALARAFFRNAPVLILDEPTASIDAKAESEIFNRVEKLSKDKTVIIISHRFSTVRNADKIYVIDDGKIIENGSHEELMKLEGQYAKLFKLQAKGYQ